MLEELLAHEFDGRWQELLGEFQLAFIVFLQLSSLAALEQWKQVRLVCPHRCWFLVCVSFVTAASSCCGQFIVMLSSCDHALHSQLPLFTAFLKLFRTHLEQVG